MDKGYLEEVASLAQAQQRWGDRVAVGRMNVVQAPGKAPRLIVDSSVCGTNGACYVPESCQLPLLESIRFSMPMRESSSVIGGFSLDWELAFRMEIPIASFPTRCALSGLRSAPTGFSVFQASS